MIIRADELISDINKKDISEILIIRYHKVWYGGTITFVVKLKTGAYLIPCYIIYNNYKNMEIDVRLYVMDFNEHKKIYSYKYIEKLISKIYIYIFYSNY